MTARSDSDHISTSIVIVCIQALRLASWPKSSAEGVLKNRCAQWFFSFQFIRQSNIRKNALFYDPFSAVSCILTLFDFRMFFSCESHAPNAFLGTINTSVDSSSPTTLQ